MNEIVSPEETAETKRLRRKLVESAKKVFLLEKPELPAAWIDEAAEIAAEDGICCAGAFLRGCEFAKDRIEGKVGP